MAAVMLAVDIHNSLAAIAGIIENQLNDFNYIFPRQSKVSLLRSSELTSERLAQKL